jgi:hypothetical protein
LRLTAPTVSPLPLAGEGQGEGVVLDLIKGARVARSTLTKKRPGWQRRAIRASRAKGGSFRAEAGQIEFRGRAGRRRRLQVAAARPVETGGAPRSRAGVCVDSPLSDVSSDHWRAPCLTCRPTVGHRPSIAVAGTAGRAGSNALLLLAIQVSCQSCCVAHQRRIYA